jgi:SAM-dependent methyltransferase
MDQSINFDLVADIYDSYVKVNLDIPFFIEETEQFDDEILELMCGTGRVSIPLLESGRKLCCVDYSEKMLQVFNNKIQGKDYPVRLIQMDVTKLDLNEKFGMIILPFHSLSEILTADLQFKALQCISKHLKPNGIFICTLQNPTSRLKTADGITRQLGEFELDDNKKMNVSYSNQFDPDTGIVSGFQLYEIFDNSTTLTEKRTLKINFRPISDSEFKRLIVPLDLQIINTYGDYSKNEFNETTSNFLIYKLKNKSTKA